VNSAITVASRKDAVMATRTTGMIFQVAEDRPVGGSLRCERT